MKKEFTIEGGEITPTMKIRRMVINKKYSKAIDKMYEDPKL
jgi:long-chain acyl-CoA synthetase